MADRQPNIHDHAWLQEATGVDPNKLGAVMLPVQFPDGMLERGYDLGVLSPDDLHETSNPDRFWIKGDVSEEPHVTILYGLLTPAYEQGATINRLLSSWTRPAYLPITSFDAFPSPFPDEPYACIVARVADADGAIAAARGLLQYLPHVDTYPDYKMHATVAYVDADAGEQWLEYLNSRHGYVASVPPTAPLDFGSER